MAKKAIVNLQINDEAFKKFVEAFNKYKQALAATPGVWSDVGEHIEGIKENLLLTTTALIEQVEAAKALTEEASKKREEVEDEESAWRKIAGHSKNFSSNVISATRSILRWTEVGGIVSGLIGVGSLFGLERLGSGAARTSYNARGLGLGYGQLGSLQTNLGRVTDASGFLSAVSGATADITQQSGLIGLGINPSSGTANVSVELLKNLKKLADNTDPRMYANTLQARNLSMFADPQTMRRLHDMTPAQFASMLGDVRTDAGRMNVSSDAQNKWMNFTVQLDRAGKEIDTALVRGLVKIEPELEKLSGAVTDVVTSFMGNKDINKWLDELKSGIENFAKYVASPKFETDIKDLASDVSSAAHWMKSALQFLHIFPTQTKDASGYAGPPGVTKMPSRQENDAHTQANLIRMGYPPDWQAGDPAPGAGGGMDTLMGQIRRLEGSGDSAVSPTGAIGRYQIEPGTARQYGLDPNRLFDPAYNAMAANKILMSLAKKYNGNEDDIAIAYNAGPGAADRYERSGRNVGVLPAETRIYLDRLHHMKSYVPNIRLTVQTTPGSSSVVAGNQAAQGNP